MENFLNYKWKLSDLDNIEKKNIKVFSTFSCGGGSTLGYKLAGFDVIAANELDAEISKLYKENFNPKYFFDCDIRDLIETKIPDELHDIDILDGSPPCSTFSLASMHRNIGKIKKFAEGQKEQLLDELFFIFLKLADKIKPKVIISENVVGLTQGKAKPIYNDILREFDKVGYNVFPFILDSSKMGIPQKRKRVFLLGIRKDINKTISLNFDEPEISIEDAFKDLEYNQDLSFLNLKGNLLDLYNQCVPGDKFSKITGKNYFGYNRLDKSKPSKTVGGGHLFHWEVPRSLTTEEYIRLQSFPEDYNFGKIKPYYLMKMSVPPIMMAKIALEVYNQVFKK